MYSRKELNITVLFGGMGEIPLLGGVYHPRSHTHRSSLFVKMAMKRSYSQVSAPSKRQRVSWLAPVLKNMAAVAARHYASRAHQRLLTGSGGGGTNHPLTAQADWKTDYRKRRIPYRRRKTYARRRKFNRRIIRTIRNANTGTTHIVRNSLYTVNTSQDLSGHTSFGLCGLDGFGTGDTNQACDDISQFLREKDPAGWAAWNGSTTPNYKVYVMHATMEMTIKNLDPSTDALVEAYYVRGRKRYQKAMADSPGSMYTLGFNKQLTAFDPDTGALYDGPLSDTMIGTTPFQSSLFCQHYKIYKRTKFRIPAGDEVNIVIHSRGGVFSIADTKGFTTDRRYHGVFFQQQGPPFLLAGTPPVTHRAAQTTVAYLSVRRYRLKMVQNNIVQDAFEITDP